MRDMYHPPVGHHEFEESIEKLLAEEAYDTANNYGYFTSCYSSEADQIVTDIVTNRLDIVTSNEFVSVRLRVLQEVTVQQHGQTEQANISLQANTSSPTVGLLLEYARHTAEDPEPYGTLPESQIPWEPYLFIGIAQENEDMSTSVLNAKNGQALSLDEQLACLRTLRALRSNLSAEEMLNDIYRDTRDESYIADPQYESSIDGLLSFEPSDYIDGYGCPVCGKVFTYCEHHTGWQN